MMNSPKPRDYHFPLDRATKVPRHFDNRGRGEARGAFGVVLAWTQVHHCTCIIQVVLTWYLGPST